MAGTENFDLVLDAYAPRNRNVRFWPAGITLRGECRWDQLTGDSPNGAMLQTGGTIPGERMLVDTKNRKVKIIDRMELPENKEKDIALRALAKTERFWGGRFDHYEKEQNFQVEEEDWPTWLWWMRRLVDHKRMNLVKGSLPEYSDILRRGRVQLGESCNVRPLDEKKPFYMLDKTDAHKYETQDDKKLVGAGKGN